MTVTTEHLGSNVCQSPEHHRNSEYIVVGRKGSIALGNLLGRLLRLQRRAVVEKVSFDHSRMLTLYEIRIQRTKYPRKEGSVDLMICLNDPGLDFEPHVRESGTLLVDANSVTGNPRRSDIEVVDVPAFSLIQDISERLTDETESRIDLSLSSLLGTIEAVEGTYPNEDLLMRLFEKEQIEPAVPFLIGVYRGYDWLQERRVRAKTQWRNIINHSHTSDQLQKQSAGLRR